MSPGYVPPSGNATSIVIALGYVNTGASMSGTALTLNAADGTALMPDDVGCVIQVSGNDGADPPVWSSVWGNIYAVTDSTHAVLSAAPSGTITMGQAIIYRPVQGDPDYYVTEGSIDFESSLSTAPTLNFEVFTQSQLSPLATFVPQVGQPVLMTDPSFASEAFGSEPGDLFGGSIEQVEVTNIPGTLAYICKCECRSWGAILGHRVLGLANAFPDIVDTKQYNGGAEVTGNSPAGPVFDAKGYFDLGTPAPLTITAITVNGVAKTLGPDSAIPYKAGFHGIPNHPGGGGFDWYYTFPGLLFQDPGGTALTPADILTVTSTSVAPQTPNVTYSNVTADVIAQDLLAFIMGPEGISIANVVPGPIVNGITFTGDTTFDDALSSILSYINDGPAAYWYYIDPRKGFHFEIQGSSPAPWNVSEADASDSNVLVEVSNATTREKYANSAYISFNKLLPVRTQKFIGNSSNRSFTLPLPCGAQPTILFYPANSGHPPTICPPVGTPVPGGNHVQTQTVGVVGQSGFEWYWSPGSSQIVQTDLFPPITVTAAIYVTYAPQVGVLQPFHEDSAIAERQGVEGGSGEYDITLDVTSGLPLVQGTPAQAPGSDISQAITKYFSYMAETVNIKTYRIGLVPAQSITIGLGAVANNNYVVQSVKLGTSGQLKFWEVTCIAGALIGDWKTAIKYMTGGGSGGGLGGGGGAAAPLATGALLLETGGVKNAIQTQLNLVPGTGVTVVDDGFGNTTISSTAAIVFAREAPAGTLDGTNVAFTLTDAPAPPESLLLTLNGVEQSPGFGSPATGADYTISGVTITFTEAPRADEWVLASYIH